MSTQKMMNPVWLVFIGVVIILFLSACDNKPKDPNAVDPDDIIVNDTMAAASDWTRFFKDMYEPAIACANNHPSKPAYIVSATPMNKGKALITVRGADQTMFECIVSMGNATVVEWNAVDTKQFNDPAFRPAGSGLPLPDSCLNNVEVKTKDNKSAGWISYRKPNCAE